MDTFLIKVPENKTSLVKKLLKELGVKVTRESKAMVLAREIGDSIKDGNKLTMDEIVQESRVVKFGTYRKTSMITLGELEVMTNQE